MQLVFSKTIVFILLAYVVQGDRIKKRAQHVDIQKVATATEGGVAEASATEISAYTEEESKEEMEFAPSCCHRDCCAGHRNKRDRCIRQLGICHRNGGHHDRHRPRTGLYGNYQGNRGNHVNRGNNGVHRRRGNSPPHGNYQGDLGHHVNHGNHGVHRRRGRQDNRQVIDHRRRGWNNRGNNHGNNFNNRGNIHDDIGWNNHGNNFNNGRNNRGNNNGWSLNKLFSGKKKEVCCMCEQHVGYGRTEWFPGEDYTVGQNAQGRCNRECAAKCRSKGADFAGCWREERMKTLRREARSHPRWTIKGMPDDWFGDHPHDIC